MEATTLQYKQHWPNSIEMGSSTKKMLDAFHSNLTVTVHLPKKTTKQTYNQAPKKGWKNLSCEETHQHWWRIAKSAPNEALKTLAPWLPICQSGICWVPRFQVLGNWKHWTRKIPVKNSCLIVWVEWYCWSAEKTTVPQVCFLSLQNHPLGDLEPIWAAWCLAMFASLLFSASQSTYPTTATTTLALAPQQKHFWESMRLCAVSLHA